MPRGRGNLLILLLVKGPSRLQQEKLQLAVAAEEKQPREEENGVVCQEERGSGSATHVEDNGGMEGKTIPIELEDDMRLGKIDSTYLKYHKVLLKRHPQPNMVILCTLSIQIMMGQAT
jgi:hypothetical protein